MARLDAPDCIQQIIQRKRKIQAKERQKYTNAKILLHTKFRYLRKSLGGKLLFMQVSFRHFSSYAYALI